MGKQLDKQTDVAHCLSLAYHANADYSEAFTDKVRRMAKSLETKLKVKVEHDDDMNYRSSQSIIVWLNGACQPVEPYSTRAVYRLIDYVSSKGPFFTLVTFELCQSKAGANGKKDLGKGSYWIRATNAPLDLAPLVIVIRKFMKTHHYHQLDGSILDQQVDGKVTDLDGKPATVFEILFSEL
jgi:hypothetical protein